MSLFTTFNWNDRTQNGGKYTASPLNVRFSIDPQRYKFGSAYFRTATRYVEKSYEWRGYTLDAAREICRVYSNGNSSRQGYYRPHAKLTFVGLGETVFREDWSWQNMTTVSVDHDDGRMYTVKLDVSEADPFWFNELVTPTTFDQWAGSFASWVHDRSAYAGGEAFASVSLGTSTPYLYEAYYDEPLTVVS